MESSRVFVKNLPPTISEAEFRKHFSAQGREVTDVKLIPHRRIGFVGYKSHDDAARAVKYLNKSFIRMSRIAVDLAKPVRPSPAQPAGAAANHRCKIADPTPRPAAKDVSRHGAPRAAAPKSGAPGVEPEDDGSKKRKREAVDEADPKLQEYLEVMGHPAKKSRDNGEAIGGGLQPELTAVLPSALLEAGESDDEYEDVPRRPSQRPAQGASAHASATPAPPVADGEILAPAPPDQPARDAPQVSADATDDDWLRSRTSRLLDLVDPDDPGFSARPPSSIPAATTTAEQQEAPHDGTSAHAIGMGEDGPGPAGPESAEDIAKLVEKTSRLFLRNLSYAVTEDDVRKYYGKFGNLEEVSISRFICAFTARLLHDEPLIGTAYTTGI